MIFWNLILTIPCKIREQGIPTKRTTSTQFQSKWRCRTGRTTWHRQTDQKTTANRVTQSQVTFNDLVTQPEQPSEPPKQLRNELIGLYSNFAKEVDNACLIAESLTMNFDKAVKSVLALIGGTDSSVDVPKTFQEAWHHPNPIKQELWRKAIQNEFHGMIWQGV